MELQTACPAYSIGAVIGGRYLVQELLGCGCSGSVYRCTDLNLGGLAVAIKVFSPDYLSGAEQRARIARELRAAFKIKHENVVHFYDVIDQKQSLGMVMEFVPGATLAQWLKSRPACHPKAALQILGGIAAGLQAIHERGLVHRDIKPANILLTEYGTPKIADLGLARHPSETLLLEQNQLKAGSWADLDGSITQTGGLVGTPYYMSPELIQQGSFDQRSDIYAWGLIAYHLLSGREPFSEQDLYELIKIKITTGPPPLEQCPNSPDPELKALIAKAIAVSPAERYQSAALLKGDLDAYLQSIQASEKKHRSEKMRQSLALRSAQMAPPEKPKSGVFRLVILTTAIVLVYILGDKAANDPATWQIADRPKVQSLEPASSATTSYYIWGRTVTLPQWLLRIRDIAGQYSRTRGNHVNSEYRVISPQSKSQIAQPETITPKKGSSAEFVGD